MIQDLTVEPKIGADQMEIKFGRAKHLVRIKLKHVLEHPIWVSAHDERHDEEYEKPIINSDDVTDEIDDLAPIITFKVNGTDEELYGSGCYFHAEGYMYSIAFWRKDHWVGIEKYNNLHLPATFKAVPKIHGESNVKFVCRNSSEDRAYRVNV